MFMYLPFYSDPTKLLLCFLASCSTISKSMRAHAIMGLFQQLSMSSGLAKYCTDSWRVWSKGWYH